MSSASQTSLALEALLTRYLNLFAEHEHGLPFVAFQQAWPSPCIVKEGNQNGAYFWKPIKRESPSKLHELEEALKIDFPSEVHDFYATFWANGICVERHDINFNMIQVWNEDDEEQLRENLLGHLFAKLKSKLPLSYFIGCTFGDEMICIDHETGAIVLEKPGYRFHKTLADNLPDFLISLQPTEDAYTL